MALAVPMGLASSSMTKRFESFTDFSVSASLAFNRSIESTSVFNCLQRKFPTQLNREFSEAYQGKFFKEQGIFTPDASILNFEQPQRWTEHAQ
jgi:hypothetical protein